MISLCAVTTFGQFLMYMSPFQNSRSAFVGSRQPMMQQAIFRPQPAFFQPQPAFASQRLTNQEAVLPPGTQFGQLQGSSGSRPPSLEEVLAERGFQMPEKPRVSTQDVAFLGKDPVTGRMRQGGSSDRGYYNALDEMYAQNPEALEIAKQYTADPSKFGGEKPTDRGAALGGQLTQTIQPPLLPPNEAIQRPGGSVGLPAERQAQLETQRRQPDYGQQVQEMQAMMREMMQMISALSNRGGFGGGYGGGFGGYSPRQQMMFGGIGSIPMSRGMFY
jgi:hypothetical protein